MAIHYNPITRHNWRLRYHLQVPAGFLTDPNGLSQLDGTYHFFHQYVPKWPRTGHGWGHWATRDFLNWEFLGGDIMPSCEFDANGAYSGSAVVRDGELWCYYTGNVLEPGDHDYDFSGRQANETLLISPDGRTFDASQKRLVLDNSGYPTWCSNHVRDPKVWEQDGSWHMLLGARSLDNRGSVVLFDSADGIEWTYGGSATNTGDGPFGYMWECPNVVTIDGREFLLVCPQGVPKRIDGMMNVHNSGYFAAPQGVLATMAPGAQKADGPLPCFDEKDFVEFDYGFDFYAPQAFVDESGRNILVGWMGLPDIESQYENPTRQWGGTLTLPRVLSLNEAGRLCQWPVPEIEALRGREVTFSAEAVTGATGTVGSAEYDAYNMDGGISAAFADCGADVLIEGIEGEGRVMLNGDLELLLAGSTLELAFTGPAGQFRTVRRMPLSALSAGRVESLRIVVDTSTVEVYVNGGETTLSSRWYPQNVDTVSVTSTLAASHTGWEMGACGFTIKG